VSRKTENSRRIADLQLCCSSGGRFDIASQKNKERFSGGVDGPEEELIKQNFM